MTSDPKVYPITAAFEKWASQHNVNDDFSNPHTIRDTYLVMTGNIGEYEHGSVDWNEDLYGDMTVYSEVCKDILLTMKAVFKCDT
jgi:hypothetical protein